MIVVEEMGHKPIRAKLDDPDAYLTEASQPGELKLEPRAPVVTVMGHVDHGKTKLLDTIRKTNVIETEAGGITQHIGAYQVVKKNRAITFIDTPGHEAFTVMRSRGARIADIAILVVAADDGVMPQTVEAIKIIQAAKLPLVVAVNKIDKPDANLEKVKTGLTQHGIQPEEWGGNVPVVGISAKTGENIDKLLETLLLVADIEAEKIRANPSRAAIGTIIEAHVDKGEGPVATVLIQGGTLHSGDPLVVNNKIYGTVRAMKDWRTENVKEAGPSMPVRILGFKAAPEVGDILDVSRVGGAEKVQKTKAQPASASKYAPVKAASTSDGAPEEEAAKKKFFNIVVRADVLGSLEAILASLEKLRHEEVGVKVVAKGLGNITETDVLSAETAGGIILGFHVVPAAGIENFSRVKKVAIHQFKVIYDLLNFVRDELEKMLPPEIIRTEYGNVKILAIFRTDKKAMTVGGRVEIGKLVPGAAVRVNRAGEFIGEGKIVTVQSGKQEVKEAHAGQECGMRYEGRITLEVGDVLEEYSEEVKKRKLGF